MQDFLEFKLPAAIVIGLIAWGWFVFFSVVFS